MRRSSESTVIVLLCFFATATSAAPRPVYDTGGAAAAPPAHLRPIGGAARRAAAGHLPTVIRPPAPAAGPTTLRNADGFDQGAGTALVAQAFPVPPFGIGGFPGGDVGGPPFAPGLQYPPDAPFPLERRAAAATAIRTHLPARPPRCPLIIKVGRGLAAPARSQVIAGRPNCL